MAVEADALPRSPIEVRLLRPRRLAWRSASRERCEYQLEADTQPGGARLPGRVLALARPEEGCQDRDRAETCHQGSGMDARTVGLGVAISISLASSALANPGDIFADVMATPAGLGENAGWFSLGHAFICIDIDLDSGIKEECYGFYPAPSPDAAIVGAPSLANEFKQNPLRFADVKWEVKKKITASQRQAFFAAVSSVDVKPYSLRRNNCGDFVESAIVALGWNDAPKDARPEPYVRALVAANAARFSRAGVNQGEFTRKGDVWTQRIPHVPNRTYADEHRSDDTYTYIMDRSNNVELRLPLKGGAYFYNYAGHGWQSTGQVKAPDFDL